MCGLKAVLCSGADLTEVVRQLAILNRSVDDIIREQEEIAKKKQEAKVRHIKAVPENRTLERTRNFRDRWNPRLENVKKFFLVRPWATTVPGTLQSPP